MGRRKHTEFELSLRRNVNTKNFYFDRLTELAVSVFKWENLPPTVDSRYLEMCLFREGAAVFFKDDVVDDYLCLSVNRKGPFDVYGNPLRCRAYSRYNNYNCELTNQNSVIIYNNMMRTNSIRDINFFADKLYLIDRIIDVNINAQKTPILLQGTDKQRLTLLNLYKEYDGNTPVIFGTDSLNLEGIQSINTSAPFLADQLYALKTKIWNEALTYLGIANVSDQKKERMITDEVVRGMGGTIASRFSRLDKRREDAERINRMFGLDIKVSYKDISSVLSGDELLLFANYPNEGEPGGDLDE